MTPEAAKSLILRFIEEDESGIWEWDDFISVGHKDAEVEALQLAVFQLELLYPPVRSGWISPKGIEQLRLLAIGELAPDFWKDSAKREEMAAEGRAEHE
ncbi:MAG: hypothetical protein AAF216_06925 [Pseudomonadota bacterium]